MKMTNIKLESGKEYTLAHLFSGKNKIIIPDLQRDYCWGDNVWNNKGNKSEELVSGFVNDLIAEFKQKPDDNLTLGLIYGYENPRYHIQLCDGQQRITTLFLILGMLYRRTNNEELKRCLISDFELEQDDKEPHLQYAIRESTLYFLSDLVCQFFLETEEKVKTDVIKEQDWYFREYDLDASIQSMLAALKTIEDKFEEKEKEKEKIDFCFEAFGNFIMENLQFIYYDMGNRTRGEETFVVINTTGEPLSATENLKPILIGNLKGQEERKKASDQWEEREEWFWKNRKNGEPTSDEALNDFFIWYWQIRLLQEKSYKNEKPYDLNPKELFLKKPSIDKNNEENPDLSKWEESVEPETIHEYFCALKCLIGLSKKDENARVLKTTRDKYISLRWFRELKDLNIVLPLIAYLVKFKEPKKFNNFVRRIRKNYFDNKWKERNKNFVDWRYIIQIIDFSKTEDDVLEYSTKENKGEFKLISNVDINEWYNDEEKWKDTLKVQHCEQIKKWEDYDDFMGSLEPLFLISDKSEEIVTLKNFMCVYQKANPKDFTYSEDKKIKNLYRLSLLLDNGSYDLRTVDKMDYRMLVESGAKTFLLNSFIELWKFLATKPNPEDLKKKLKDNVRKHYRFIKNFDNYMISENTEPEEIVNLWALLEFLYSEEDEINYGKSIACFYDKNRVLIQKDIENKFQIGNFCLGVSKPYNKNGFDYNLPLMKSIHDKKDDFNVKEKTKDYKSKIKQFIQ